MDRDFFFNTKFNLKDINEIIKKMPQDKKITRDAIIGAFAYDAENMKEVTEAMLTIFDKIDGSTSINGEKNGELDYNELGLFLEKVKKAAVDDEFSRTEARTFTNDLIETEEFKKNRYTPDFMFNFLRVLQVNMEDNIFKDPSKVLDELVVTPGGNYGRDSLYQKGQIVNINTSDNDFGYASNWIQMAKNLYRAEGYTEQDFTSVDWNRRAYELRELNGNKELSELSRIKIKLSNDCIRDNQEKLETSYYNYLDRSALPLAQKISYIVDNNQSTNSVEQVAALFNNNEINSENIVPLFYMYQSSEKILNGDKSLIDAIMSETALTFWSRTEVRDKQNGLMHNIVKLLDEAAKNAGVDEEIVSKFSNNLNGQLANIFIHPDLEKTEANWDDTHRANFEGVIKAYISTIIAAQKVTEIDSPLELANQSVMSNIDIHDDISGKFKDYEDDQGWFSDAVDSFTAWFGARTRHDIQNLLDRYLVKDKDGNITSGAIKELKEAVEKKDYEKFKAAYEKCFGVPFDPKVIQAQNEIGTKLMVIDMTEWLGQALTMPNKNDILKKIEPMKKSFEKEFEETYGKKLDNASSEELKEFIQNQYQIFNALKEGILAETDVTRLRRDYERLTQASPLLIVQDQVESYMSNQSTCVACAEIIGDIILTAALPGGSLMLLGKLGTYGKRAKTLINVITKVADKSPKLALARNLTKTGSIVFANHKLTYGQDAITSLKAAGEMSMFGLVGFGTSSLSRVLIKGSGTFAKLGQEAASLVGDAAFMEMYGELLNGNTNLAQDLTQFMAIYILGKMIHATVNGNKKLTDEEKSVLENIKKELGINKPTEQIEIKDLLKLAKKKIKNTELVKSIEKAIKPDVKDIVHVNENFYEEFIKTGKPYEIAECEDGTYVMRFKDNTLNAGNKYTYCILDKNKKLIKKYDNITTQTANETIPNHRRMQFTYHSQQPNYVYVSFDAGIIENLVRKISAQVKYTFLNRKVNKLNDILNFYGIKEEPLKSLSDTETNKLIENLEIFEAATENMTPEQIEQFSKLFKENPDITRDLSTMNAVDIAKKIGVERLDGGKEIQNKIIEICKSYEKPSEIKQLSLNEIINTLAKEGMSPKDLRKLKGKILTLEKDEVIERKLFKIKKIDDNTYEFEFYGVKKQAEKTNKPPVNEPVVEKTPEEMIEYIKTNSNNSDLTRDLENLYMTGEIDNAGLKVIYETVKFAREMPYEDFELTINSIESYKKKMYYEAINKYLRGESIDDLTPAGMRPQQFKKEIEEMASNLRYILGKQTFTHELKLYRRDNYSILDNITINYQGKEQPLSKILMELASKNDIDIEGLNELVNGKSMVQEGALSTALNQSGADSCERGNNYPILWNFKTEGSYKGMYIDAFSNSWNTEVEFLLQCQTKIKITHIDFKNGSWIIDATLTQ